MWTIIRPGVVGILGSATLMAGIYAAIAAAALRLGWNVSAQDVSLIVGPIVAGILVQASKDFGKSKAEIENRTTLVEVAKDADKRIELKTATDPVTPVQP